MTIKQLREYGVEPACPTDFLEKAQDDFLAGFFSFSHTHAKKGLEAAQGLLQAYTEAWNAMYYAYDDIQKAREHGDVQVMEKLYEEAEESLSESNFEEAAKKALQVRRMVEELYESGEPNFVVELTSGPLKAGIWNRSRFVIRNNGKSHARGLRMRMSGPVEIINLPEVHKLEAGSHQEIEIGIKPNHPGEFPLEVWFKGVSMATGKNFALFTRCWVSAPKDDTPTKAGEVEFFDVNEVFLIYNDGRLIHHASKKDTSDVDEDILSSMLVAIRNFVRDSFRKEEAALKTFSFGDNTMVIEKGNYLYLAVMAEGTPPRQLVEIMGRTMERVELNHAGIIEEWDGQGRHFSGVEQEFEEIFELASSVKMKASKNVVRVKSGLEFYRGFVRLKVAVINGSDTVITDARLLLTFNRDALRLDRVEPEYDLEGSTVDMGTVHSKEKKTVAYYLDPLICQESTVDCTLTYKDFKGSLQHIDMKRRPVDIVCPLFYTPQTLNIAMLKRLISDLSEKDSKIFAIPEGDDVEETYERSKDVIQGHDIRFVREMREDRPKIMEAWFYGRVKETGEEMVMRISVREDTRTLMVNVASSNLANLTGILAELGHTLSAALAGGQLVVDDEVRETVERGGSLLDKLSEAEVAAESTEVGSTEGLPSPSATKDGPSSSRLDDIMRRLRKK